MQHTTDWETVEKMLSGLLGREVLVSEKPAPKPETMKIVGFYRNGEGTHVGVCLADVPMAAYSGSALSLIPPAAAKDCVKAGEIDDEDVRDNFYEVLNVCSRLFADDDSQRVALDAVYFPPEHAPGLEGVKQRRDLELNVDGYGKGRLSLLVF